jgi:multidrug resistance efflux pump
MNNDTIQDLPAQKTWDHAAPTEVITPVPAARQQEQATYRTRGKGRLRGFLRVLRTTLVVIVLLAAALAGGAYVLRDRLAGQAYLRLGTVVLTAQPIPVGTAGAGVVSRVLVTPQTQVSAGQELARVTVTGSDGRQESQVLKAPTAGIVSTVDVAAGSVAAPGQQVVTLYDPAQLTFQAKASVDQLRRLRRGMTAKVAAKGLPRSIGARLDRVTPQVGGSSAASAFTLVLVPDAKDMDLVRTLVPGLPFTATVDTKTAPGGTPAINSAR